MAKGDGAQRYEWSPTNPNDGHGGGGCLCGELAQRDRGGPYKVFTDVEMDNYASPRAVLCNPCAGGYDGRETVQVGQGDTLDAPTESVTVTPARPARHENPATEGQYPDLDADTDPVI